MFAGIQLIAVFCAALAGCVKGTYDDGYEAGFSAGVESVVGNEAPAETEAAPEEAYGKEGFALITDVIPDAILEIRYYSTFNFVGERIDAYEAPVAYLTKEAAAVLKNVSDDLMAQGYRIKIYDAYRPQTVVDHFKPWAEDL